MSDQDSYKPLYELFPEDEEKAWEEAKKKRAAARRARLERERRARQKRMIVGIVFFAILLILVIMIFVIGSCISGCGGKNPEKVLTQDMEESSEEQGPSSPVISEDVLNTQTGEETTVTKPEPETKKYTFTNAASVGTIPEEVKSKYAVMIDCDTNQIIAGKEVHTRMIPASMIKVLTVLTAYDYVENLDDSTEITIDVTDYSFVNDCSNVGYGVGDKATIRDLFYGTIMPSGADAAIALAKYCAGTWQDFVVLMNQKIEELGLQDTHVTNCVGIHEEGHYSTVYDMAVILRTAMDNPFLNDVLSVHKYTTGPTMDHPEGILISNWFLRRIEDKDCHGTVVGAKTGYVDASGSCAASYATDKNGKTYILVTGGSTTSWRCINDQVAIFQKYLEQ